MAKYEGRDKKYIARCHTCQQVKVEHQSRYDMMWVAVDKLTNLTHFLVAKTKDSIEWLLDLYIDEKVWLHRVPKAIISY